MKSRSVCSDDRNCNQISDEKHITDLWHNCQALCQDLAVEHLANFIHSDPTPSQAKELKDHGIVYPVAPAAKLQSQQFGRSENTGARKPACNFGENCYNTKPEHLERFWHPRQGGAPKQQQQGQQKQNQQNQQPYQKQYQPQQNQSQHKPYQQQSKRVCKFGENCHNTRPDHLETFLHPHLQQGSPDLVHQQQRQYSPSQQPQAYRQPQQTQQSMQFSSFPEGYPVYPPGYPLTYGGNAFGGFPEGAVPVEYPPYYGYTHDDVDEPEDDGTYLNPEEEAYYDMWLAQQARGHQNFEDDEFLNDAEEFFENLEDEVHYNLDGTIYDPTQNPMDNLTLQMGSATISGQPSTQYH